MYSNMHYNMRAYGVRQCFSNIDKNNLQVWCAALTAVVGPVVDESARSADECARGRLDQLLLLIIKNHKS